MTSAANPGPELEGGCQCGSLRYRIDAPPLTFYTCHCTHCQRQSASAFGLSMWVDAAHFQFVDTRPAFFETRGDSGAIKTCAFCPACGSRIFHRGGGSAGRMRDGGDDGDSILSLKGGTLDSIKAYRPVAHIWTRSALPWVKEILETASPSVPRFDREPTESSTLIDLWQQAHRVA